MIEVILIEKVENLGKIGDLVRVKSGYARNYLLPQNKALRATQASRELFEKHCAEIKTKQHDLQNEAEALRTQLENKEIILIRAASASGQLYGSVTARNISNALAEQFNQSINRNQVVREMPVKNLGIFPQRLRLHGEVSVLIDLNVAKSREEAKLQRLALEKEKHAVKTAADKSKTQTRKTQYPRDESNEMTVKPVDSDPQTEAQNSPADPPEIAESDASANS